MTSVHIGWILHTMAFLKQVYIVKFCSGALRDRWLYSHSEALSALGRAWKVIHNEGVWGGGSLAGVGSIHWDESNTSPPSNSHSLLSVFLRLSKGWVEHEDPPLKCLMKNTSHLQQSTLSSFITNNLNNVLKKIIPTLNSDWMSQSSLNYCKIANHFFFYNGLVVTVSFNLKTDLPVNAHQLNSASIMYHSWYITKQT